MDDQQATTGDSKLISHNSAAWDKWVEEGDRWTTPVSAALMRRLYGLGVTDLGPYRAIRADLLGALDMREMTYGWPTEMTVKAARRGARVVEVPVTWANRRGGRSKVSGTLRGSMLAAVYILGVTLRYARRERGSRKGAKGLRRKGRKERSFFSSLCALATLRLCVSLFPVAHSAASRRGCRPRPTYCRAACR